MSLNELLASLEHDNREPCYPARLNSLASKGIDTKNIEDGIHDTLRVLEKGERSFVIYGEPQSGKTEFMIALTCKLIDIGYQTIFVVMNDNTELETQNFDRFHRASELNPTPLRDTQLSSMNEQQLRTKKQRVIFCRKNSKILQKLIELTRFMDKRVVIDDEADFATPNARINKDEVTAINQHLGSLGELMRGETGVYIGVTATPARLDLNNTFLNNSHNWIFLNSHDNYKGRSFFFPTKTEEIKKSDYVLVRLPEEGDDQRYIRHAIFRFLIRVAILNVKDGAERTAYSMLVHTAGRTNDHERDQQDITSVLSVLSDRNHNKFEQFARELLDISAILIGEHKCDYRNVELVKFIIERIGQSEVLVINHRNDSGNVRRVSDPKALFTFAVGGNIVSRGLTFENLLTFFFSRNVRGRLQQNTYIQRARMFGNRPYSEYFELCIPDQLFDDWATCFNDHELSLRLARAGVYQHIQSGRTAVVDRAAMDMRNVTIENSERAVGDLFPLSPEIEKYLIGASNHKPITLIEDLVSSGLISHEHFPNSLMTYLRDVCAADESDIHMVLRIDGDARVLQNIERYTADGDQETITRSRGGIIHAMLNRRREYDEHKHFILPIRNELGMARFLYKAKLGHSIIQNLRVRKAISV